MIDEPAPEDVTRRLRLDADEDLLLTAWQYRMMQRDIAATTGKALDAKRAARNQFRTRLVDGLRSRSRSEFQHPRTQALAGRILASDVEPTVVGLTSVPDFASIEDAAPTLTEVVGGRSRAVLLLIDLYGFEPWPGRRWKKSVRTQVLDEFRTSLSPLREEDIAAVAHAYETSVRALAAKSRSWGKVALYGAAGLGLGALTAGLATPIIGAMLGSAVLGFSGAAATSAGLAALGGGSLAAGGLGMAGGTVILAGIGGITGMGAVAAGAHTLGLTTGQIAADVIRLEVATQLVLRDIDGDDRAAKAVVLALRQRMIALRGQLVDLARRIDELKAERDAAIGELKAERAENLDNVRTIDQLRTQLSEVLRRERDDDAIAALDDELRGLLDQSRANTMLADFVESRADYLGRSQ